MGSAQENMIGGNDNTHPHSGVAVSDLFVKAKHDSFGEEYKNYKDLNIVQCKNANEKALKYLKTPTVKSMKAGATGTKYLHYEIEIGTALRSWHLLSLIFYCDFSDLCTTFSTSFRALKSFETLRNIKKRNAMYYWMSRHLRELVELFGQCAYGDTFEGWNEKKPSNAMAGPYYVGIS